MTPRKFEEFLTKQQQEKQKEVKIDWEVIKQEWQARAEDFVKQVQDLLSEFGAIATEVIDVQITEEKLGKYQVPKLRIILPNEEIELKPIGTLLIGAHGRFDLIGSAGTIKWVLVPEGADRPQIKMIVGDGEQKSLNETQNLVWKLATPPPHIRYLSFEKEVFLEAIMEVSSNG